MKGRETGLSSFPTCFFQPPINHSRPKPPLFKINDGDYQQEKWSLARAPKKKKNCRVRQAIRWPKCPRLPKVQNENKCCSRKRKINWIYHDNKQSFLFFFSLVHNVLLIFCFIQLHKRLEKKNQTVNRNRQQQKAKLSLFLLITAWSFSTITDFRVGSLFNENTLYHHNRHRRRNHHHHHHHCSSCH